MTNTVLKDCMVYVKFCHDHTELYMTTDCFVKVLLISLLLLEIKVRGKHIIDQVVKVCAINQPLSLVAWVHGHPAELII